MLRDPCLVHIFCAQSYFVHECYLVMDSLWINFLTSRFKYWNGFSTFEFKRERYAVVNSIIKTCFAGLSSSLFSSRLQFLLIFSLLGCLKYKAHQNSFLLYESCKTTSFVFAKSLLKTVKIELVIEQATFHRCFSLDILLIPRNNRLAINIFLK